LITFYGNVNASSTSQYYLVDDIANVTSTNLAITSNNSQTVIIDTGSAEFTIDKLNFNIFKKVVVDGQIITDSSSNGIELIDQNGKVYKSNNAKINNMTIIEQGPLRLGLKLEGTLQDDNQADLTDYFLYIYFYANKSYAQVLYTIGNHNQAAQKEQCCGYDVYNYNGQSSISFEDLNLYTYLYQPVGDLKYFIPSSSQNLSGVVTDLSVYQDSSGTDYWNRYNSSDNPRPNSYSSFRGYKTKNGSSEIDAGNYFPGWFDVSDSKKGVAVAIKNFWQNFPKGLSATQEGRIAANIFPIQYNGQYNFRVGEEKTTELLLYFHTGTGSQANVNNLTQAFQNPLFALAGAQFYIDSQAIAKFTPETTSADNRLGQVSSLNDFGKYAYYNDRTIFPDNSFNGTYYYPFHSLWESTPNQPSSIDYFNDYSWAFYGNQPLEQESTADGKSSFLDNKYDFGFGAWIQFLRTGDPRWENMAETFSRNTESLMLHDVITETGWDIYRWKDAIFGHSQHNEKGDQNGARNYLGPVMDTAYGVREAALNYYLTGYQPNKRVLDKAGEYAYNFYFDHFESDYLLNASERYAANLLSILVEAFVSTGDRKYQQLAQNLIEHYAPEKQPYINGPVTDSTDYVRPWMLSMYLNAMARYIEATKNFGLTNESNTAKNDFLNFINWIKTYAVYENNGWLTTYYSYNVNGQNEQNADMINNWMLTFADNFAYAYGFTNDENYLTYAQKAFSTGVNNPFYLSSPLIYSASKEAVNHAVFGSVYMYYAAGANSDQTTPSTDPSQNDNQIDPNSDPNGETNPNQNQQNNNTNDSGNTNNNNQDTSSTDPVTGSNSEPSDSSNNDQTANSSNLIQNGSADNNFDYWNANYAVSEIRALNDGNQYFALMSGYLSQDIDISSIGRLGSVLQLHLSANMKSYIDQADKGTPYIYGYIIGSKDDPNFINTYFALPGTPSSTWINNSSTFTVPQYSRIIRVFLRKTSVTNSNNNNPIAYFDNISITIDEPTSSNDNNNQNPQSDNSNNANPTENQNNSNTSSQQPNSNTQGNGDQSSGENTTTNNNPDETNGANGDTILNQVIELDASADVQIFKHLFYGEQEANGNYGALDALSIYNGSEESVYRSLLRFDLELLFLPTNAKINSVYLQLWCNQTDDVANNIYNIIQPWTEGTGTYGDMVDGASWTRSDGETPWESEGGNFDPNLISSGNPQVGTLQFDITELAKKWLTGETPNYGLIIAMPEDVSYKTTAYESRESADASKRPKLIIHYVQ